MSGPSGKHSGSPKSGSNGQKQAPLPKQGKRKELRADFLLNFDRPSAHQRPYQPPPRRSRPSGRQINPTAFVRGRFVQSSFRLFVDEATPDVVEAAVNADALIDWPHVLRVDLFCEEHPKCPICLEEDMVLPKITRCGHIFCMPCGIRYFLMRRAENGKDYQKCPVCNEQATTHDLKSVRFQMMQALRDCDNLSFTLAHRAVGSTVVRSALAPQPCARRDGPDENDPSSDDFLCLPREGDLSWHLSRLVRLTSEDAVDMILHDLEALRSYRPYAISAGDTELLPSIDEAIRLTDEKLPKQVRSRSIGGAASSSDNNAGMNKAWGCKYVDVPLAPMSPTCQASQDPRAEMLEEYEDLDLGESPEQTPLGSAVTSPTVEAAPSPKLEPAPTPIGTPDVRSPVIAPLPDPTQAAAPGSGSCSTGRLVSFYQAADGRLVFLQPFFTRLLLHEYGGRWDSLPPALPSLRLEACHELSVTEETRKRHKFLAHLPLGSQIAFAEVDLRNHLSRQTKEEFSEDFAKRRQQRKKEQMKSRREDRISKQRMEDEEQKYWQSINRSHPSAIPAPPTKEDFAATLPGRSSTAGAEVNAAPGEGEPGEGADAEEEGPTLADKIKEKMAKAAQAKEKKAAYYPALRGDSGTAAASSTAASGAGAAGRSAGSAWGPSSASGRAAGSASSAAAAAGGSAKAAEPVHRALTPMDDQPTFGEALQAALSSATKGSDTGERDAGDGDGGRKKKGKAGKKATTIRLFG